MTTAEPTPIAATLVKIMTDDDDDHDGLLLVMEVPPERAFAALKALKALGGVPTSGVRRQCVILPGSQSHAPHEAADQPQIGQTIGDGRQQTTRLSPKTTDGTVPVSEIESGVREAVVQPAAPRRPPAPPPPPRGAGSISARAAPPPPAQTVAPRDYLVLLAALEADFTAAADRDGLQRIIDRAQVDWYERAPADVQSNAKALVERHRVRIEALPPPLAQPKTDAALAAALAAYDEFVSKAIGYETYGEVVELYDRLIAPVDKILPPNRWNRVAGMLRELEGKLPP